MGRPDTVVCSGEVSRVLLVGILAMRFTLPESLCANVRRIAPYSVHRP